MRSWMLSNLLEPCAGKLARTVLRGGWCSNALSLPGGRQLVKVNPKGTSQKCSGCGEIVPKTLAVRIHSCKACGLEIDRDENAARNIHALQGIKAG